jgi:hypothetical protein
MRIFRSFQLVGPPWTTSRHNIRIFSRLFRHLAAHSNHLRCFLTLSDILQHFPWFSICYHLCGIFYYVGCISIGHIHISDTYPSYSDTFWHFRTSFILPLFGILTVWLFHLYFDIFIGWLMLLSFWQHLRPTRRSFRHYSDPSDILFIFISPLLYLNFGIT